MIERKGTSIKQEGRTTQDESNGRYHSGDMVEEDRRNNMEEKGQERTVDESTANYNRKDTHPRDVIESTNRVATDLEYEPEEDEEEKVERNISGPSTKERPIDLTGTPVEKHRLQPGFEGDRYHPVIFSANDEHAWMHGKLMELHSEEPTQSEVRCVGVTRATLTYGYCQLHLHPFCMNTEGRDDSYDPNENVGSENITFFHHVSHRNIFY